MVCLAFFTHPIIRRKFFYSWNEVKVSGNRITWPGIAEIIVIPVMAKTGNNLKSCGPKSLVFQIAAEAVSLFGFIRMRPWPWHSLNSGETVTVTMAMTVVGSGHRRFASNPHSLTCPLSHTHTRPPSYTLLGLLVISAKEMRTWTACLAWIRLGQPAASTGPA